MTASVLRDAFAHHIWASERLIDECTTLTSEQLRTPVAGTYGSIIDTLRHLVRSDGWYLSFFREGIARPDGEATLGELRSAITRNGAAWMEVLAGELDADADIVEYDNGWEVHLPLGFRLAQVIHHGSDHRSHVCTGLTILGLTPPEIDIWAYARATGRERAMKSHGPQVDLEYTGLKARAWDALRGDTSDWADRAFYLELIRELGQPVLDVGCGTGRLLLDFVAAGVDVDGVEISSDMLSILRARSEVAGIDLAGRVHQSAMQTMALPRRYRLILVPSSSFQLLVDPTDAASAMRRFHDHLESLGTLVMPWIGISQDYPGGATEAGTKEVTLQDGSLVRLTYRGWFDPATGYEQTDELYERLIDGEVVEQERTVRSPATRHYDRAMIESLHATAGLGDLRWLSGFTRDIARPDDRIITTLARRTVAEVTSKA